MYQQPRYYGQLRPNPRMRKGRNDPNMSGWIILGADRASICAWTHDCFDDQGRRMPYLKVTLKPWGSKSRKTNPGELKINTSRRGIHSDDPHLLGVFVWGGRTFSAAAWVNATEDGQKYLKLTAQPI